jgi:hypothetical protein
VPPCAPLGFSRPAPSKSNSLPSGPLCARNRKNGLFERNNCCKNQIIICAALGTQCLFRYTVLLLLLQKQEVRVASKDFDVSYPAPPSTKAFQYKESIICCISFFPHCDVGRSVQSRFSNDDSNNLLNRAICLLLHIAWDNIIFILTHHLNTDL